MINIRRKNNTNPYSNLNLFKIHYMRDSIKRWVKIRLFEDYSHLIIIFVDILNINIYKINFKNTPVNK